MNSDERLLLEVYDALRGADSLRDNLLTTLQTGSPSVSDLAYAIKARVKEDYKCVDKVIDRRKKKPNYGVGDVTDLVGLRVITLYRLDVLDILEALLSTIAEGTSGASTFVANSISEITIYSTNPTGDAQDLPSRLLALFQSHGLGTVAKIAEKPSNYTSIHIVVRGRGKYRDGYREIPVEIQVRTALEDVWGQIEHSLKYKRERIETADGGSREEQQLATTLSHLGVLKTLIDGVSQYADQIKLQIDEIEPGLRYAASRSAEEPNARLGTLKDLPEDIRNEINSVVLDANPALVGSALKAEQRVRDLRHALSRLDDVAEKVSQTPDLRPKTLRETGYVLTMQRALVHFQLGNLLGEGEPHLQQSLHLYESMETTFPKRLIVTYRYARALDAAGRRIEAIAKLRLVVKQLNDPKEPLPKKHWIRSAAPRILGVLLWEEADAGRQGHGLRKGTIDSHGQQLLREAFQITLEAYRSKVREDPEDGSAFSERTKAANNLLYYLLEYLEAGGEPHDDMRDGNIRKYLKEIGGDDPSAIESVQFADTVRRTCVFLKEHDLAAIAAKTVVRLSPPNHMIPDLKKREMLEAALHTIAQTNAADDVDAGKTDSASDGTKT